MPDWSTLLRHPDDLTAPTRIDAWFAAIAERLLNGTELFIARQAYRFLEIEFYLFGLDHEDPFTHHHTNQYHCGHWHFHRTGGSYRGGSFKGIDLTFGNGKSSGGILLRSVAGPDGSVIAGPSLCVDHLLHALRVDRVAELDRLLNNRGAFDADNPLSLRPMERVEQRELLCTARVGLSLKKAKTGDERTRYLMRPYRYLNESRAVRKGKPQIVLALHVRGDDVATIHRLTGSPRASIQRYISEFEAGRQESDCTPYFGSAVRAKEWCRLYGIWQRLHG